MRDESSPSETVMPIDFVISKVNTVDKTDKYGATPLHRAVTIGEVYTKRLLEAGANPAKATHQGMTPLHLASRSRQSNVVGMLLEVLRSRTPSSALPVLGVDAVVFRLTGSHDYDQMDAYPTTPLFYACRSRRPETVALLLEAGADIQKGNVLHACAGFERENEMWQGPPEDSRGDPKQMRLTVMDEPIVLGPKCPLILDTLQVDETGRLEEILDMLVKHGLDPTEISRVDCCDQAENEITKMDNAMYKHGQLDKSRNFIDRAFFKQDDYTGACFRATCDSAKKKKEFSTITPLESLHSSSKNAAILALRSPGLIKYGEVYPDTLVSFLRRREYRLVEEMARIGVQFLPTTPREESNLTILVQNGYFALCEKIGAIVAETEFERGNWHAFGDKTRSGLWLANRDTIRRDEVVGSFLPFLTAAVMRELPNMEIVKLLVEKFHVDVDEVVPVDDLGDATYEGTAEDSALHTVSLGCHWWHAHQALPYLLRSGANIDLRDSQGQTALHAALGGYLHQPFQRDAARLLIEAGADVNAVDESGADCLAYARGDFEMSKLLISRGAVVTTESIFRAIIAESAPTLKVLLSSGISANTRRKPPSEDVLASERKGSFSAGRGGWSSYEWEIEDHEIFPLSCAGLRWREIARDQPETLREAEAVFEMVLLEPSGR